MMQLFKYVIIGGGIAAGSACSGIRKLDPTGSIALVTRERHLPYQRPPLSKGYLVGKEGLDKVYLQDPAYYPTSQIEAMTGTTATALEPSNHSVYLEDGRALGYEKLLLATGGYAWRLPIPGAELPGVMLLRTIDDADAIRAAAGPGRRVVVIGGSFIGCEVAASLAQLGAQVTMVFPDERLLVRVAPAELGASLAAKYRAHGVRLVAGSRPEGIAGSSRAESVTLTDGETIPADLVVMGVGIRLNVDLARAAGLALDDRGAVLVDETLRTSDPDVYAAGDIASWPDRTFGRRLRVEHWDVARQQGQRAGRNMAGEGKPYRTLPYFYSDLFDLSFEAWGDLSTWEQTVLRGSLERGSFAFYYFAQGALAGVLAVGRPEAERKPMQALVRARLPYNQVAGQLASEQIDLSLLAPTA
jgi:3-phenylpropionate/trans-cinnamate dioxygenase ferredoxin reductase component